MDTLQHLRLAESPVYFKAGDETLFGILTVPRNREIDTAAIMLTGRGFPSYNRNRLSVHLGRRLADLGFATLRFDYHGVGESSGVVDGFDIDRPFVQDLRGAFDFLASEGLTRYVLIGSCFGARTALALASEIEGLRGLIMVAVPLHDDAGAELALRLSTRESLKRGLSVRRIRRLFDARHRSRYLSVLRSKLAVSVYGRLSSKSTKGARTSPIDSFSRSLESTVERDVPVLLLYGTDDRYYRQFKKASRLGLGNVLEKAGDLVTVVELDGEVHGFTSIEAQTQVIDVIESTFREQFSGSTN